MNKFYKVIKIVFICVLVALGLAFCVLTIINTSLAKKCLDYAVSILNQPLPVIGITVGACLIFVWRLVISTNYGKKKLEQYDLKLQEIDKARKLLEQEKDETINELKKENELLRQQVASGFALSTNKKVKEYGKELENYGKETFECETKTN